jgi:hypothetical protein
VFGHKKTAGAVFLPESRNFFSNFRSNSLMNSHIHAGGGWLVLLLALTAPAGAAPEAAGPNAPTSPPAPANVAAPAPITAAGSPVATSTPRLSPEIASQITSALPVWSPPPAEPAAKPSTPPPPSDPEVVEMAKVVVWDHRLPRTDEMGWLTPHAKDVQLVKTYITPFDRYFLSRFTLPLFGSSAEARAREMYEEDKRLENLKWINEQIDEAKLLDSQEAKALLNSRNTTFERSDP